MTCALREWFLLKARIHPRFIDRVLAQCDDAWIGSVENLQTAQSYGLLNKIFKPVIAYSIEKVLLAEAEMPTEMLQSTSVSLLSPPSPVAQQSLEELKPPIVELPPVPPVLPRSPPPLPSLAQQPLTVMKPPVVSTLPPLPSPSLSTPPATAATATTLVDDALSSTIMQNASGVGTEMKAMSTRSDPRVMSLLPLLLLMLLSWVVTPGGRDVLQATLHPL
eukprot:CAMPEP_0119326474 /NCGR_PEP_ID=MMETSP1333-20130426/68510_1 /TAXON_ID=418940 /ORGANISM="Scyphosphaera apsteinii, Strain RCC1455" /LENGTH=219 /DNA_ID=CAMNT_0007334793 /DNA_START=12 /DNA_END=671 /DNA_ORIENTATION=+